MDTTNENYFLSWGGFQRNLKSTFADLAAENYFTDVTLVCDGEKQIAAHKVVLGAGSPFFKHILIKNPHQHPLIYLKGVQLSDLKSLIEFIYFGEVKMRESDVQTFLKLSEELEVKGLSGIFIQPEVPKYATEDDILEIQSNVDDLDLDYETDLDRAVFIDDKDDISESAFKKNLGSIKDNPVRHKCSSSVYSGLEDDNLLQESSTQNDDIKGNIEPVKEIIEPLRENPRGNKYSVSSSGYSEVEEDNLLQETSTQNEEALNLDQQALKSTKRRSISLNFFSRSRSKERRPKREKSSTKINNKENLKKLDSIDNLAEENTDQYDDNYECDNCGKLFKFEVALSEHKETIHEGISYQCVNCDTKCRTKENLHRHMELKDHY